MLSTQSYTAMIREFFRFESAGGLMLVLASILALALANSPLAGQYTGLLDTPIEIRLGPLEIAKPLLLWINDGLMAVFFFLIGLEIKREFFEGELSNFSNIALPGIAAIGGMAVPALIYVMINWGVPQNLNGWAIPAATDIAFALAILTLLGNRIPASLKALLLAIAIFDDLAAIIIIAFFYTQDLAFDLLGWAGLVIAVLAIINIAGVKRITPYVLLGAVLWVLVLKSGVHATLAGVVTAFAIPMGSKKEGYHGSPLKTAEHTLHPWVAFLILPLFAFSNAGISFQGIGWEAIKEPVQLGITLGLFLGKQIGVFALLALCIALRIAPMPQGATWLKLYGISLLTGIGFTMSLFIGSLAFEHADFDAPIRLGVIAGSLASALFGFLVLSCTSRPPETSGP